MVERTLSSFPKFLSDGIGNLVSPGSKNKSLGGGKGFELFLQSVHANATTYEQEQAIKKELSLMQQKLSSADVSQIQIRDYLCRAIYCGMLGYDVSFAYIHAVKLAQQGSLLEKRIGYLAASLLLHPGHELVLLLVNTIQKDLRSSNILDNCMALSAASQLIGTELIPALLPMVLDKLRHGRELIRQKAVICLYRFQLLAPELLAHVHSDLERALFDKDPGVMAAANHIVDHNIQKDPTKYLHLVPTLISILQQIMSRKMSTSFEYHSVPFPWLQIKILHCLANMAAVDEQTGKKLSPLVVEVLQRATSKENIAYALVYECLLCISLIKPDQTLMQEASRHVGRFMRSADSNLQYVGVKALIGLVKVDPSFVMDYQNMIVECLEHSDKTIQRKMYKLLHQIANPTNVVVICSKLLCQLETSLAKYWRSEVITMVMDLTRRFTPSTTWPYETKLKCLQLGGSTVTLSEIEFVIRDMNTGCKSGNMELKQFLVKKCVELLMSQTTHPNVIQVTAWTLTELSSMLTKLPEDRLVSLFTRHLCNLDHSESLKACLISSLQKLVCANVIRKETMATYLLDCLKIKHSTLIKQRITILYQLCKLGANVRLNQDPEKMDFTLSFLDNYVSQRIEQGANPYKPRCLRLGTRDEGAVGHITQSAPLPSIHTDELAGSAYSSSQYKTGSSASSGKYQEGSEAKLDLSGKRRVWGKQGILSQEPATGTPESIRESYESEIDLQKKEMTAALFGGLAYKENEESSATKFGATDQDLSARLSGADSAGWRSFHKHQTALDKIRPEVEGMSLESCSLDLYSEDREFKVKSETHETQNFIEFTGKDLTPTDTGYESKVVADNHPDKEEASDASTVHSKSDTDLSYENHEISSIQGDRLCENKSFDDFSTEGYDRTSMVDFKSSGAIPKRYMSNENVPKVLSPIKQNDNSGQKDLDDALSMLLNDSSNFVNISVAFQDLSSESVSSSKHSCVVVRESLYNYKEDRTLDDILPEAAQKMTEGQDVSEENVDVNKVVNRNVYDENQDVNRSVYDENEDANQSIYDENEVVNRSVYDEDEDVNQSIYDENEVANRSIHDINVDVNQSIYDENEVANRSTHEDEAQGSLYDDDT